MLWGNITDDKHKRVEEGLNDLHTRDQLSRDQLPRDQLLQDQLFMKSTTMRSTLMKSTLTKSTHRTYEECITNSTNQLVQT